MATNRPAPVRHSPVAYGLALFAGTMMLVSGTFHLLQGIVAVADESFYVRTENYTFDIDLTTWGWTHIIAGVVLALVGLGVITGTLFARILGIIVVAFVMVGNFPLLPYYPVWSLLLIAFNAAILWGLATDAPSH